MGTQPQQGGVPLPERVGGIQDDLRRFPGCSHGAKALAQTGKHCGALLHLLAPHASSPGVSRTDTRSSVRK